MWTNGTARHGLLWRGWQREGLNKGDFQRTRSCILSTRKGTQEVGMTHARTALCSSASDTHQKKCMSKAGTLENFKMDRKHHLWTVAIIFGKHLCQPISNFNAGTNTIRNCQNTSSESAICGRVQESTFQSTQEILILYMCLSLIWIVSIFLVL